MPRVGQFRSEPALVETIHGLYHNNPGLTLDAYLNYYAELSGTIISIEVKWSIWQFLYHLQDHD